MTNDNKSVVLCLFLDAVDISGRCVTRQDTHPLKASLIMAAYLPDKIWELPKMGLLDKVMSDLDFKTFRGHARLGVLFW